MGPLETATKPREENEEDERVSSQHEVKEAAESGRIEDELTSLQAELEKEKRISEDLAKRIQYLQADMINVQRQSEKILAVSRNSVLLDFMLEVILIKEDIERAISAAAESGESGPIIDGLNLVISRIVSRLKSEGVDVVNAELGMMMDPHKHEAVSFSEISDKKEGTILSIIRDGYTLNGKVIRPTLVEVARQHHDGDTETETVGIVSKQPEQTSGASKSSN